MENGDSTYRPRGASRPPQEESGASREEPLFTEIPLNNARRTPNSGRPNYSSAPAPDRSAARNPYGGRTSDSYLDYARRPDRPRPTSGPAYSDDFSRDRRSGAHPSASFTEISWDSFRQGN